MNKKNILFISILIIFSLLNYRIYPDKKNNNQNETWKRHFFDLCFTGGFSFYYFKTIIVQSGNEHNYQIKGYGCDTGLAIGYQYAFNKNFAFGPGISIFGVILYENDIISEIDSDFERITERLTYDVNAALMFQFMFGDLKEKKWAVLLDFGGGWIAAIKLGIYANGFVFKTGYHFSLRYFSFSGDNFLHFFSQSHHITFDIGYKFNWSKKNENNKNELNLSENKILKEKLNDLEKAKKNDIVVFNEIIFYANSDKIKPASYKVLNNIATILLKRDNIIIEIGGFTNSTGNPEKELELSIKRAQKVSNYLINKGINENRIKIKGFGGANLKEINISELNRRVEIKILKILK